MMRVYPNAGLATVVMSNTISFAADAKVSEKTLPSAPGARNGQVMPQETKASRQCTIELRVERVSHLFDPFDPFPIPSRDLAKSAEEFILGWARELPRDADISILIHMPECEAQSPEAKGLKEAIARHFTSSAERVTRDLNELFRVGRLSLAIGLGVLAACIIGGRIVTGLMGEGPIARLLAEGLLILGWVANWRPIEIFLYDWWPLTQRRRLHCRLAGAPVDVELAQDDHVLREDRQ